MKAKKRFDWKWFLLGVIAVLAVWILYILLAPKAEATLCVVSPVCEERILNEDNPQYVLGWNACFYYIHMKLFGKGLI